MSRRGAVAVRAEKVSETVASGTGGGVALIGQGEEAGLPPFCEIGRIAQSLKTHKVLHACMSACFH